MKIFSIKLKLSVLFYAFLFPGLFVKGQTFPTYDIIIKYEILKTDSLNAGVYRTFFEFQQNKPTIKEFKLGGKRKPFDYLRVIDQRKLCLFTISGEKYKRYKEQYWGICDGEDAFIFYEGKYYRILRLGKYCLFENVDNGYGNFIGIYAGLIPSLKFMINIKNGNLVQLTHMNLLNILKSENEVLYNEFKNDSNADKYLINYLDRINKLYIYE